MICVPPKDFKSQVHKMLKETKDGRKQWGREEGKAGSLQWLLILSVFTFLTVSLIVVFFFFWQFILKWFLRFHWGFLTYTYKNIPLTSAVYLLFNSFACCCLCSQCPQMNYNLQSHYLHITWGQPHRETGSCFKCSPPILVSQSLTMSHLLMERSICSAPCYFGFLIQISKFFTTNQIEVLVKQFF